MSDSYRSYQYFSETFKRKVCEQVQRGVFNPWSAARHYGFGKNNVYSWMRKFGYSVPDGQIVNMSNKPPVSDDPEALKKRIADLEKELESATLKAHGLDLMIDIAEEEFKVPIRKKSSTKRSKD